MKGATTGLALTLLLASGCSRAPEAPTGQVAATVNGIEITDAMIDAEARAGGVPRQAAGSPQVRKGLLGEVIARTLLVEQARKNKLDQTPQALADLERQRQDFVARLALTDQVSSPGAISDAAVQHYIAGHSELFGDRTLLQVDEIRYWNAGDPVGAKYLKDAQSLEEVQQNFALTRKPFKRRVRSLDPLVDGNALIDRLAATPPGQLYHYEVEGMDVVGSVLGKSVARIPADQAADIARDRLRRAGINQQVTALLDRLKKDAKILYRKQPE